MPPRPRAPHACRVVVSLSVAWVLAAAPTHAQDRAVDRRLAARLDAATAAAVQRLADSARRVGLPSEPLVQKALEGSTLGAPGDRIVTAVRMLIGQLGRAREALGPNATAAELTAGAAALRAGVQPGALTELRRLRSGQSLVVPVSVLTDLVAEGVSVDQATASVFDLARRGRSDADFLELRRRADQEPREPPPPIAPGVNPFERLAPGPGTAPFRGVLDLAAGTGNVQSSGTVLLHSPRLGIFSAELSGNAAWGWYQQRGGTTTLNGGVRGYVHLTPGTAGWIGYGGGTGWSTAHTRSVRRKSFGASTRVGPVDLGVSVASTSFDALPDAPRPGTNAGPIGGERPSVIDTIVARADTVRREVRASYTDAVLRGRWRLASFDLDASLGRRFSRDVPRVTLWNIAVARRITPQMAVVMATGRVGVDPGTALPGSKYFLMGLRLSVDGGPPAPPRGAVGVTETAAAEAGFRVGAPQSGMREVVVAVVGATVVELAGDFTDWEPVGLVPAGRDEWRGVLPIPPGLHRLAVRVDGGAWRAPPSTRQVVNEFGTEVGEIVVE